MVERDIEMKNNKKRKKRVLKTMIIILQKYKFKTYLLL